MASIVCKGITPTEAQLEAVQEFIDSQRAGDLVQVTLYPNLSAVAGEHGAPSGMQAIYNMDASVDPTCIGDNMFQVFAVSRLLPEEGKGPFAADHFDERAKHGGAGGVQQVAAEWPLTADVRNPKSNKDRRPWESSLGGPGSFVGLFSAPNADDHQQRDWFVAARGAVPELTRELRAAITEKRPTFRQLMTEAEWTDRIDFCMNKAAINVGRNLIAEATRVGAQPAVRIDDVHAKLVHADHAPPEVAVPDWEQRTHTIARVVHNGRAAVMISYGVVPSEQCQGLADERFFVVGSPYDGISMFRMTDNDAINEATGLPADTGLRAAPVPLADASPAHVQLVASRVELGNISWDGRSDNYHADLHPHAFRPVDAAFSASMQAFGWADPVAHPVQRLTPKAIKIWK